MLEEVVRVLRPGEQMIFIGSMTTESASTNDLKSIGGFPAVARSP
ncbi:MAG: hypothetical protein ACRDRW_21685 [Pseudonocardiaceae bacterium]